MIDILEGLDNCGKNTIANKLCVEYPTSIVKIDFSDYEINFRRFIKEHLSINGLLPLSL